MIHSNAVWPIPPQYVNIHGVRINIAHYFNSRVCAMGSLLCGVRLLLLEFFRGSVWLAVNDTLLEQWTCSYWNEYPATITAGRLHGIVLMCFQYIVLGGLLGCSLLYKESFCTYSYINKKGVMPWTPQYKLIIRLGFILCSYPIYRVFRGIIIVFIFGII